MPSPPPCCCFCWCRFWDEAFERGRSRGLCSPCTPQQGHRPCTRSATQKTVFPNFFPHAAWRTNTREPTGSMKTKKRAAERMHSLTASFLSFSPDAKHPVGGVSHRQPVARSAGIQLAKFQSFICENLCACCTVPPGNCLCDKKSRFRKMGAGSMTLLGCGAKPHRFPAQYH